MLATGLCHGYPLMTFLKVSISMQKRKGASVLLIKSNSNYYPLRFFIPMISRKSSPEERCLLPVAYRMWASMVYLLSYSFLIFFLYFWCWVILNSNTTLNPMFFFFAQSRLFKIFTV